MPRCRNVSCSGMGPEDIDDFDDQDLEDVEFVQHQTPPEGYFSPDSAMGPSVGSPMNITGLVIGTPQSPVSIPSITMDMSYDNQGNVVPSPGQRYSEAEEDFLNRTIGSPSPQRTGRRAGSSCGGSPRQGSRTPGETNFAIETPPGWVQPRPGRRAQLWGNLSGQGGSDAGGSTQPEETNFAIETPPGWVQPRPGRKAQLWGNGASSGSGIPRPGSSGRCPAMSPRTQSPGTQSPRTRSGHSSRIPIATSRDENSSYQAEDEEYDTPRYNDPPPARRPVNFMQRNVDNLKKYPDPKYQFVREHKFPAKPPPGSKRTSEPTHLRDDLDMGDEDLDVSAIPVDPILRPFREHNHGHEPMVSGMISHVCSNRGWSGDRNRPHPGINQSMYGGRFTSEALSDRDTFIRPPSPSCGDDDDDDDIQVLHPHQLSGDDSYEQDEFDAFERHCNDPANDNKTFSNVDNRLAVPNGMRNNQPGPSCANAYTEEDSGMVSGSGSCNSNADSVDVIDLCDESSIFMELEKRVLEEVVDDDVVVEEDTGFLDSDMTMMTQSRLGETDFDLGDLGDLEKSIREENEDADAAIGLSLPSRVNTEWHRTTAGINVSDYPAVGAGPSTPSRNQSEWHRTTAQLNVSDHPADGARPSSPFTHRTSAHLNMSGHSSVGPSTPSRDTSEWHRTTAHINVNENSPGASGSSTPGRFASEWHRTTAYIPVLAENRDLDHVFAAAMISVQEQGLSLSSPPNHICNLLFPEDVGDCQITAILDAIPLEGAVVPMRPSRMRLPPNSPDQMDQIAVLADSFIRSAPNRSSATHLNATLGTHLNVTNSELADGSSQNGGAAGSTPGQNDTPGWERATHVDPVEASRSIAAINAGRLVGETDFILDAEPRTSTWIQLRGNTAPNWFPGYYVSLPAYRAPITLVRTASEVLPQAWYAAQADSFPDDQLVDSV